MAENYTSLILMAGQGLLEDTALAVDAEMSSQLSDYTSQTFITTKFNVMVSKVQADEYDMSTNPYGTSSSVISNVIHSMDVKFPGASNVIPTGLGITTTYFSTFLQNHIDNLSYVSPSSTPYMDNGVFCQRLQVASGYADYMNTFVNSAVNGQTLSASTFQSMDALTTANIALVNPDTQTFGQELQASGDLYNFNNVNIISTPHGLAEALVRTNTLSSVAEQLEEQGIDTFDLREAIESNPDTAMKPLAQKRLYRAFSNVTGTQLEEILLVLGFETPGITVLTDLLDLRKVFPESFDTLQVVLGGTVTNIYLSDDALSSSVEALSSPLEQSFPPRQAKAAKAFGCSLQQIKSIHESSPQALGAAAETIEKNTGLDFINALTGPMPTDTVTFYKTEVGGGNGPESTFFVTDLIGTPAGVPHTENLTTINDTLDALTLAGAFAAANIELVFTVIGGVADGTYDDNPGVDGQVTLPTVGLSVDGNTYPTHDAAITALLSELDTALDTLVSSYGDEVTAIGDAFSDSIDHVLSELENLTEAQITFITTYTGYDDPLAVVPSVSKQSVLSFATSLPTFGQKTDKGNMAEILEYMATNTRGGEAVIGAMREARNGQKFNEAGIKADNKIDDSPQTVIPGDIS